MGPSYAVELSGAQLRCVAYEAGYRNPTDEAVTPTAEQWTEFRSALESIGVP